MSLIEHFRAMLDYEQQASTLTARSIRSALARAAEPGVNFEVPARARRAAEIFGHIQEARRVWLTRIGALGPRQPRAFVMWPSAGMDQLEADARDMDAGWAAALAQLTDADLARDVGYSSTEGVAWHSTLGQIVTHVLNHSTYHRGQIAMLVAQCGGERATTDFIFFNRRRG